MTEAPIETYGACRVAAERASRRAGEILLTALGRVKVREKRPGDLVTEADRMSQRSIAEHLAIECPGHTLLAEEDDMVPDPANPWRWVVDPLDGTINYAHGFTPWCVSIALEHAGRLVVGVVHVPLTGEMYSASLGEGATLDGRPLHVSDVSTLRESLIATGLPTDFAADADRQLAYLARFSTGTHSLRRTGSTAWNLAQVARGTCEVCYATSIHPWDVAAGVVLIREAGGRVGDLSGGDLDLYRPGILATNGRVHEETLASLAACWPSTT